MAAAESLSVEEQLARARDAREQRAKAASDRAARRELEALTLEAEFEQKTGGSRYDPAEPARGGAFAIVNFGDDVDLVVLTLVDGAEVLLKRLQKSNVERGDISTFVIKHVAHPDPEKFREAAIKRPMMWDSCLTHLMRLYGLREADLTKKA